MALARFLCSSDVLGVDRILEFAICPWFWRFYFAVAFIQDPCFPLQADLYHNQLISLSFSFDSVVSGTQFIPRSIMCFTSLSYILLLRILFFFFFFFALDNVFSISVHSILQIHHKNPLDGMASYIFSHYVSRTFIHYYGMSAVSTEFSF
ncbi:hypothetical protein MAP00_008638 [Monascus purpureus]|nr:hypothetical protein MAP00_008638 [Monascus purpureus]